MGCKLDSTSKFNIYTSFTLSNDDVASLSLLYAPLMGSDALMLYLGFSQLLERNNLKSEELVHQDLFDIYNFKPEEFLSARNKLEGIGLMITYFKNNHYIYVLCPPLTPKNFIKDATLGLYLYSKVRRETFDYIYNHFKIDKIDKASYENITKGFDDVFDTQIDSEYTFDKFKYILGRKPNGNIKLKHNSFDFELFSKEINKTFLGEVGITKNFTEQIINLAFVYGFDEYEMISLYGDSINRSGLYDYRLLKNKANIYFNYKRNMRAPKLVAKEDSKVTNDDLVSYLDNVAPSDLLGGIIPDYPSKYLETMAEIYSSIELPRGVVNCMILKILKDKGGELPSLNYFKKASESWIRDNVFTTSDAIKYITTLKDKDDNNPNTDLPNGGFREL